MVKIDPAYSWKDGDDSEDKSVVEAGLDNLQKQKEIQQSSGRPEVPDHKHEFEARRVRSYLMEWHDGEVAKKLPIDWSKVSIKVSARMKKASGKCKYKPNGKCVIKIAKGLFSGDGDMKQTARHEAVHAWQHQADGVSCGHGQSFKQWLDDFGISVYAESRAEEPKYEIICPNCGVVGKKSRKCKTVKQVDRYSCNSCGSHDLSVNQNY